MARRVRAVSEDETRLFREAMKDATPLKGARRVKAKAGTIAPPPSTPPSTPASAPRPSPAPPPIRHAAPPAPMPPLAHGGGAGVDKRTLERFRKGERTIDARLDLHGMTQDVAYAALHRFIERSVAAGHRCVIVVTGKGGREGSGVLRAEVPRWLNQAALRPHLLAIQQARPQHGGAGALYLLLRRKR